MDLSAIKWVQSNMTYDVKQQLCHLMGIASQKEAAQPVTLVYLFFAPVADGDDGSAVDRVFTQLTAEIDRIFKSAPHQMLLRSS